MFIDLQWWQAALAIITGLGLSAAPWIAALLAGRIMTLGQHTRRVADLDKAHGELVAEKDRAIAAAERRHDATVKRIVEERDYERAAKDAERQRSDKLADKLGDVTEEFGQTTVHLLKSLGEVNGGG